MAAKAVRSSAPSTDSTIEQQVRHELADLKDHWWWFLVLGIAMIFLGFGAIGSAFFVTLAAVMVLGILIIAGGIGQIVSAFWTGQSSGFLLHVLIGILYIIAGLVLVDKPIESAAALTLLMAVIFFVGGLFKLIGALSVKFDHWGWTAFSGVISILLGLMIYRATTNWEGYQVMVIGLFIGIEMIFHGWAWVMVAIGVRSIPDDPAAEE